MLKRTFLIVIALMFAVPAAAQHTVFLVRHAERADTAAGAKPKMASDPDLSAAGRERAASLATVLKDANITAIFATEFKRTQQTAAPLAKALGINVTTLPSGSNAELLERIKSNKGNVLVVGHSNTIPEIIKSLGMTSHVSIEDDEFDNLFVVTLGASPALLRLHYR